MSITIRTLKNGTLTNTSSGLYSPAAGKSAIIQSIRLINKTDTDVTVIMRINTTENGETNIIPPNTIFHGYSMLIDDHEITMQNPVEIRGLASASSAIDYLISGIERDI